MKPGPGPIDYWLGAVGLSKQGGLPPPLNTGAGQIVNHFYPKNQAKILVKHYSTNIRFKARFTMEMGQTFGHPYCTENILPARPPFISPSALGQ